MEIIAVFHGAKAEGLSGKKIEVASNPPITIEGMEKLQKLVPVIRSLGPYSGAYCSRLERAAGTVSMLALALDIDFQSKKGLGLHRNFDVEDGKKTVYIYPGYVKENFITGQKAFIEELRSIAANHGKTDKGLIVSHRPLIASGIAFSQGIYNENGIQDIIDDPLLIKNGYVIFDINEVGDIQMIS